MFKTGFMNRLIRKNIIESDFNPKTTKNQNWFEIENTDRRKYSKLLSKLGHKKCIAHIN